MQHKWWLHFTLWWRENINYQRPLYGLLWRVWFIQKTEGFLFCFVPFYFLNTAVLFFSIGKNDWPTAFRSLVHKKKKKKRNCFCWMVGITESIKDSISPPLMFPNHSSHSNRTKCHLSGGLRTSPKWKFRGREGSRKVYEHVFLSQTNQTKAQHGPPQSLVAFAQDQCRRGGGHASDVSSMCLARGIHRANLTSLVHNHDRDANFLCEVYD